MSIDVVYQINSQRLVELLFSTSAFSIRSQGRQTYEKVTDIIPEEKKSNNLS